MDFIFEKLTRRGCCIFVIKLNTLGSKVIINVILLLELVVHCQLAKS